MFLFALAVFPQLTTFWQEGWRIQWNDGSPPLGISGGMVCMLVFKAHLKFIDLPDWSICGLFQEELGQAGETG